MVPHQQQGGFAFGGQPGCQPRQKLGRHRTDWSPVDKAEEHALCIRASQPITRDRFRLGVGPVWLGLDQVQGRLVCPRVEVGLGEAAPPDFILKAQDPIGMPRRQCDQPIAPLFFRA